MKCANCGIENQDSFKFCGTCGTPLFTPPPESFQPQTQLGTENSFPQSTSNDFTYSDADYRSLMIELETLSTFAEAANWDTRARSELARIVAVIRLLDAEISKQQQVLHGERQAHEQKSFLNRMFINRDVEERLKRTIIEYQVHRNTLEKMIERMQEAIDFTPVSPAVQKIRLDELRQRKKELQLQKRAVNSNMRAIRLDARQRSAEAGLGLGGLFYDETRAARQRRGIRYAKEEALQPHENQIEEIERKLVQVEHDMLWVKRFE